MLCVQPYAWRIDALRQRSFEAVQEPLRAARRRLLRTATVVKPASGLLASVLLR